MINKKDYEAALKQFEDLLVNASINIECYKSAIEMLNKKIAEFPVEKKEDDPMPEGLKEVLNA